MFSKKRRRKLTKKQVSIKENILSSLSSTIGRNYSRNPCTKKTQLCPYFSSFFDEDSKRDNYPRCLLDEIKENGKPIFSQSQVKFEESDKEITEEDKRGICPFFDPEIIVSDGISWQPKCILLINYNPKPIDNEEVGNHLENQRRTLASILKSKTDESYNNNNESFITHEEYIENTQYEQIRERLGYKDPSPYDVLLLKLTGVKREQFEQIAEYSNSSELHEILEKDRESIRINPEGKEKEIYNKTAEELNTSINREYLEIILEHNKSPFISNVLQRLPKIERIPLTEELRLIYNDSVEMLVRNSEDKGINTGLPKKHIIYDIIP
jgi:hypothetical protein